LANLQIIWLRKPSASPVPDIQIDRAVLKQNTKVLRCSGKALWNTFSNSVLVRWSTAWADTRVLRSHYGGCIHQTDKAKVMPSMAINCCRFPTNRADQSYLFVFIAYYFSV